MKSANRALILGELMRSDGLSRVELSARTGLSKGGLTTIIRELIELGLINEVGCGKNANGRKPIMLRINPECVFVVVVEWTRWLYRVSLSCYTGRALDEVERYLRADDGAEDILCRVAADIEGILTRAGNRKVIGISVVAPGPIDYNRGIILAPANFNRWHDIPVKERLEAFFHLPVFLNNDAGARTIGEKNFGLGRGLSDFICLVVGEGIGAGACIRGEIYWGGCSIDLEFGHTSIDFGGVPCECGNHGCLEKYASVPAMQERYPGQAVSYEDILCGLDAGDPLCLKAVEQEAYYLSAGIANLINTFRPQAVILTGEIARCGQHLKDMLDRNISARLRLEEIYIPKLLISTTENGSNSGGAANVFCAFIEGRLGRLEDILEGRP